MLSLRFKKNIYSIIQQNRRTYVTRRAHVYILDNDARNFPKPDEEYTEQPEYPEIKNLRGPARKERETKSWHDKIKKLSTVEEKLFEINMPKYYGYKTYMLNDKKYPYNTMPFIQYATRTHFEEQEKLPNFYSNFNEKTETLLKQVKGGIEDAVAFELAGNRKIYTEETSEAAKEELVVSALLSQMNRVLLNSLSAENPHLNEIEIDIEPSHEAFWILGGIKPPTIVKKMREGNSWSKHTADQPYNRPIQYLGTPYLALRHKNPLPPLVEVDLEQQNFEKDEIEIPSYKFDPITLGYITQQRHGTTNPGFWPGDHHEFGLVSFQRRSHMLKRHVYCAFEDNQALHCQGMLSSYAWAFAQACYQGFSTFNDVTYPLTAQTVLTNGKTWSFYAYQLNTTLVHDQYSDKNARYNQCWGTKEMNLFEEVDDSGKIHGFNDEVLANLIKFYVNQPKAKDVDLKPFLCKKEPRIANIVEEPRRLFMEARYKHMLSNRGRHRLVPEIYNWEKIYKIDNKTRQLDAKRRFFELGINPYKRTMDEHSPVYIPRAVRPGGPKSKPKFEETYYPNVRR